MKIRIRTAHGYLSWQPDGRIEYRPQAGSWEELDLSDLSTDATIQTAHGFLSFQPDGRIEYRQNAGLWETIGVEGLIGPTPTPTPPPSGDPLYSCGRYVRADLIDETPLVACLCTHINPAGSVEKALDVTSRVAWALREQGAGLLRKDSGENIADYHGVSVSVSRVFFRSGRLVKVLTDVPTTCGPSWQDNGTEDPSRWVAPFL